MSTIRRRIAVFALAGAMLVCCGRLCFADAPDNESADEAAVDIRHSSEQPGNPPAEPTSPSEPDADNTTSPVDSATGLEDGYYVPDDFTFSGGTGKTRIVCDEVIIRDGHSCAVIRFQSTTGTPSAYQYVKASGNVYYPAADGNFTLPVTLNANNRILGMTTKMSAAHEIEYNIYIQLKNTPPVSGSADDALSAGEDADSRLDETAPEIPGQTFRENIKTTGARYLRLFQYDQGVVLAEIDLRRDTVLDTGEAVQAQGQSTLYQADVLKYLLVPAGVELPAGLERDYLMIGIPASNICLMDETLAGTLDRLGAMDSVRVLPEDCEDESLIAMLESGEKLPGGTWQKPDYRTLVKEKIALGLIGAAPLTQDDGTLTIAECSDRLTKLTDRFDALGIPLVIDRSSQEPEAEGRAAWLKLYGILFGRQEAAGMLYDAAIAGEDNS